MSIHSRWFIPPHIRMPNPAQGNPDHLFTIKNTVYAPCQSSCDERTIFVLAQIKSMHGGVWRAHESHFEVSYPNRWDRECPMMKQEILEKIPDIRGSDMLIPSPPRYMVKQTVHEPSNEKSVISGLASGLQEEPAMKYTLDVKECTEIGSLYALFAAFKDRFQ